MKKLLFTIIVGGVVAFSYFYSSQVYHYYLSTWYFKIRKETRESLFKKADALYAGEQYRELDDYLDRLLVLYPGDITLEKARAMNYLKLGDKEKAVDAVLSISDKVPVPEDILKDTILSLYEKGFYREIIGIMKHRPTADPDVLYPYGVSLYVEGDNRRSLQVLKQAIQNGKKDHLPYLYAGLAAERMKDYNGALEYYREAWNRQYRNPDVNRALVRLYRIMGKYDEAAKLLRLQKKW